MDFKIQKLDQKHRNYSEPINARWHCELNGVEYFNRTQDGLRECIERMLDIQKNGPKKPEPRRGSSAAQTQGAAQTQPGAPTPPGTTATASATATGVKADEKETKGAKTDKASKAKS